MKASIKRFWLSGGIFAVLLVCTGLVFRRVSSTEQFYSVGVFGVLLSFLTVAWARIPKEDFQLRDGTRALRAFRRFAKLVFTGILGSAALLCFGVFVLVLWIRISRGH
jgi:hypothetical protein